MECLYVELQVLSEQLLTNGFYYPFNDMISNTLDTLTAFFDLHS